VDGRDGVDGASSGVGDRGAAGDGAGFDAFVASRGAALLRFAYVLTADAELAQDVVQEALVKAFRSWDRVRAADQPEAYVRRIVVNEYTSWRRRLRNRERPTADSLLDTANSGFGAGLDAIAERDVVWRAMAGLPPRQRAVLVLRFYEDLSEDEIARVLGCAGGTVRSLATRALATLRSHPQVSRTLGWAPSTVGEER
jgi:RNA polymerase sigma-70 factor (sigma-E family)